ncbi:hypothetical protein GJ688_07260 [Heliobacillus mobilis]|uniref:Uncharacterized protein n=1 Tax=Heliobacterium mobile TaxID=28064 RepID=A0A6I3SIT3_HELMO|nr:hypothetical protein [Heliobacterium mobile]MTV48778.1 hypothetical protein [Heliobacterium mobile]
MTTGNETLQGNQSIRNIAAQDPENITAVAATEFSDRSEKAIIRNVKAGKGRI